MRRPTREDLDVLNATRDAIEALRGMGVLYADLYSPLHDDGIGDAMRRLAVMERPEPLGDDILEVVSPPVFGRYLLQYSVNASREQQRFARRHGLGHVAAGHVAEVSYLAHGADWRTHEERVCDLFAMADLLPSWQLELCREKLDLQWRTLKHDIVRGLRQVMPSWPDERIEDRAQLRLALFRYLQL